MDWLTDIERMSYELGELAPPLPPPLPLRLLSFV